MPLLTLVLVFLGTFGVIAGGAVYADRKRLAAVSAVRQRLAAPLPGAAAEEGSVRLLRGAERLPADGRSGGLLAAGQVRLTQSCTKEGGRTTVDDQAGRTWRATASRRVLRATRATAANGSTTPPRTARQTACVPAL